MPSFDTPLSTGLLDDYDFTVTGSEYVQPEYMAQFGGGWALRLTGTTDDPDKTDHEVDYKVGAFESRDGGQTIVRAKDGADAMPNKNSGWGLLFARAQELGIIPVLQEADSNAVAAKVWVGLQFHMKRESTGTFTTDEGKDKTRELELPVQFLGKNGVKPASAGASPNALEALAAKKAAAANGGTAPDLLTQLTTFLAAEKAKGTSFIDAQRAAIELPGISEDETVLEQILDENGLWASV